jgi:hypothetical protein
MRALERRLDALEDRDDAVGGAFDVPMYPGMTLDEALSLHFGPGGAPRDAVLVVTTDARPPDGIDPRWAERRGTPEYAEIWERLGRQRRREAVGVSSEIEDFTHTHPTIFLMPDNGR